MTMSETTPDNNVVLTTLNTVAKETDDQQASPEETLRSLTLDAIALPPSPGKRPFAIANAMAQATHLDNLCQITVTELRKQFVVDRALIYQFQSSTHGTIIAESLTSGYRPVLGQTLAALAFGATTTQHYQQQAVVSINNIAEEAATPYQAQIFQHLQVQASLGLPLFLENQLWGLLVVQNCAAPRQWNDSEIARLYQVGTELTLKLQPLQLQAERQLISSLSDKLRQASDQETIFRSVTRDVRNLLNVDRVAICQFRQDYSLEFIFESKVGQVAPMLNAVLADSHLQTQKGGIFRQSEPFVVNHVEEDPTLTPCHIENLMDFDIKACAIVAIYQGQKLWGLLGAYQHSGPRYWDHNEVKLLTQLSNLVGVSLHQTELMEEMAKASENQEALPDIINKISNTAYAEKIYQTAVQEVRNLLTVEHVCIYKFRPDYFGDFIYESGASGWPSLVGSAWEDTYVQENQGGRFRNTEQPFLADDIYTAGLSECHIQTLEHFGVKSFLVVAIKQEGNLWGLLSAFQHSGPRHWLESDVKVLQEISRQMEASLKGADYVAQLQEQSAQMTKAAQIGRAVSDIIPKILQAQKTEQILKLTQQAVRQLLKCDRVAFHRFNANWSSELVYKSSTKSQASSDLEEKLSVIWPNHNLQETQGGPYRDQESLVVNNIYAAGHAPLEIEMLEEFGINAYMAIPIFKKGQLWGVLSAYQNEKPRSWTNAEINALKQISLQVGAAMQQADYLKRLTLITQQEQLISNIIDRLRKANDLPQTLTVVARDIREMLQADRVGMYQFNPATNYNVGEFVVEDVAPGIRSAMAVRVQDHCFAAGQAENYQKGRSWIVNDVKTLDLPTCLVELLASLQVRASLVVPLLKGDVLWGLFAIHQCQGPREWQDLEVEFVHRIGTQLNLALQQADYLEQLQEKNSALEATATREKQSKERLQQQVMRLLTEVRPALDGDLTVRAPVTDTEVGTVASAYNNTLQSLQKIVLEVKQAAGQVGQTSQFSRTSMTSLNQQAQKQATALDQTLTRVQEMLSLTEAVANDAQQVETAVQQANLTIQSGDTAMNNTVSSIMAIRATVADTSQRIKRLSESSQKISKVVNLISHFTNQTQLLSLNASIEATRAGEYGRGFAVVADEVRSLARQSAEAATEIEQLVQDIQIGTAEVSTAMETGIQQVAEGTSLVTDTRQNLTAIVEATSQISKLIEGITQITHRQVSEFKDVTVNVNEATEIANQTSTESEQLTQAIHQLLATAEALQASTNKFKVA
ncbi:GAF domain-containing protein [Leptolyngbya cf. ectocarpi LEGE 11479]|uniref:GAF domain-containing protein n=1 Tax=Leptolyngbya cf. ectocarpi LEGE 11479 TaxID=1828722 RepID=A0A928X1G4_LEPEC|nr:GAF domain-containing protein [Leptolyngbya ectocarpi]MBE9065809.1 GAF domain-containing protein [Leptolyngbya cf. ectocarpi LEGE 11479]